jgi:hypothetical protein
VIEEKKTEQKADIRERHKKEKESKEKECVIDRKKVQ